MFFSFKKIPLVLLSTEVFENTIAVRFVIMKITHINIAILIVINSLSMHHIVFKISFIPIIKWPNDFSLATPDTHLEFTFVETAIFVDRKSISVKLIILVLSLITETIGHLSVTFTMFYALNKLTFINITILVDEFTVTMINIVAKFTLIPNLINTLKQSLAVNLSSAKLALKNPNINFFKNSLTLWHPML